MFCKNCGNKMIVRLGGSSWTYTALCTNENCRTKAFTICCEWGSSDNTTYKVLSKEEYNKLHLLMKSVGENGRIPD